MAHSATSFPTPLVGGPDPRITRVGGPSPRARALCACGLARRYFFEVFKGKAKGVLRLLQERHQLGLGFGCRLLHALPSRLLRFLGRDRHSQDFFQCRRRGDGNLGEH